MLPPRRLVAALILVLVVVPGCGGGGSSTQEKDARSPSAPVAPANRDPEPSEDIGAVIARVQGATTASSCDPVKGLMHSSYGTISDAACEAVLGEIDGFGSAKGKTYGTGAVIDFMTGSKHRLMVLTLDSDRTYKIDFTVDVPSPAVGSDAPPAAAAAARVAVSALQSGDCDAFLRNVDRRVGLGQGSDQEVCERVSESLLRRELLANTSAAPKPLGGNSQVSFFKLRTGPGRYYTLVVLTDEKTGAKRYGVVNALGA